MDHELKNLVLNINQLAALSGLHRQTVVARLKTFVPLVDMTNSSYTG